MMENNFEQVEDFLMDEKFRNWVLNPNEELTSYWDNWLSRNPDKEGLLQEAIASARSIGFTSYTANADAKERILKQIKTETPNWNRPRQLTMWNYWSRIAAILVVTFGLGYLFNEYLTNTPDFSDDIEIVYRENPNGVRSHYSLSDGSEVYLNAGSSIEFPRIFDQNERIVKITGEAYFEVKSDKNRPFKVLSENLEVKVLGTKFNFNSDADQQAVALLEGSVAFTDLQSGSSILLNPGQMAEYDQKTKDFELSAFDQELILGWKNGHLMFKDASFKEVISNLEKWYGVSIASDSLDHNSDWSYSGKFRNESLETVLLNMSTVKNFSYEIDGKNVRLKFSD